MKFTYPVHITIETHDEVDGRLLINDTLRHRRTFSGDTEPLNMSWSVGVGVEVKEDYKRPKKPESPECDCTRKSETEVPESESPSR